MKKNEQTITDLRNALTQILNDAFHGGRGVRIEGPPESKKQRHSIDMFHHIHEMGVKCIGLVDVLEERMFPDRPKPPPMPTVEARKPGGCPE